MSRTPTFSNQHTSHVLSQPLYNLPLPSSPPNSTLSLPSMFVKTIYIIYNQSGIPLNVEPKVTFRFVATDKREDIKEEISKAFDIERFSLRDPEKNIVTGSFDSLETNQQYEIIPRTFHRKSSRKERGNFQSIPKRTAEESDYEGGEITDSLGENESRSFDNRSGKRRTKDKFGKKRRRSSQFIRTISASFLQTVKRPKTTSNPRAHQNQNQNQQAFQETLTSRIIKSRQGLLSPEDEFSDDNQSNFKSSNDQIENNEASGSKGICESRTLGKASKRVAAQLSNSQISTGSSQPLPKACSRCRKGKKGCNRCKPCERCIKAGCGDTCDAGELANGE
ncbi:hypothetical protein G9A89_023454 [Geosiphon pyriformis]|nr:hypothetical protein G9A89_023454 [Geosiphon pyriformis]